MEINTLSLDDIEKTVSTIFEDYYDADRKSLDNPELYKTDYPYTDYFNSKPTYVKINNIPIVVYKIRIWENSDIEVFTDNTEISAFSLIPDEIYSIDGVMNY